MTDYQQPDCYLFKVQVTDWESDGKPLRALRQKVFIEEQRVPVEDEWDGLDDGAQHIIAQTSQGHVVGTARLLPSGQIGRMAVLKDYRGNGLGANILRLAVETALIHGRQPFLHAQTHAIPFYEKQGFIVEGDVFMDAGIPHRNMVYPKDVRPFGA